MFELPRREQELVVEVEEGSVRLIVAPLTDAQYYAVNEASTVEDEGEEAKLVFRASRVPGLFEDRLRRVEGVAVDGAPFDVAIADHVARVPQHWKGAAVSKLIRYAMGLSSAELGNSPRPPATPPAEGTPSTD